RKAQLKSPWPKREMDISCCQVTTTCRGGLDMGGWYRVTKNIKGHQYIYEQQTYRVGNKVRTLNRYIGAAGGERSKSAGSEGQYSVTTTAKSIGAGVIKELGKFGKVAAKQVDVKSWGVSAAEQLGLTNTKKKQRRTRKKRVTTTSRQSIYIQVTILHADLADI